MSKPFNLADAKAGHPVMTADGQHNVKLYDFDYQVKGVGDCMLGVAHPVDGGFPIVNYWTQDGVRIFATDIAHLVMAPLGTVDGREVYPGDMLISHYGHETPVPYGVPFEPHLWNWPIPARSYPTTQLSREAIAHVIMTGPYPGNMTAIANAAIKHGIDNGYLIDGTEHADLLAQIAEAVGHVGPVEDLPAAVKRWVKTHQDVSNDLGQVLAGIAKHVNLVGNGTFKCVDVLPAIKEREVHIANHFLMLPHLTPLSPGAEGYRDALNAELAKVK